MVLGVCVLVMGEQSEVDSDVTWSALPRMSTGRRNGPLFEGSFCRPPDGVSVGGTDPMANGRPAPAGGVA